MMTKEIGRGVAATSLQRRLSKPANATFARQVTIKLLLDQSITDCYETTCGMCIAAWVRRAWVTPCIWVDGFMVPFREREAEYSGLSDDRWIGAAMAQKNRKRPDPDQLLGRLVPVMVELAQVGRWREVLLVRACVCGLTLKRAVGMTVEELRATEFDGIGLEFNRGCWVEGRLSLARVEARYLDQLERKGSVGDSPVRYAFPSRKGRKPITPRAAERLLRDAWTRHHSTTPMTFREIRKLGASFRSKHQASRSGKKHEGKQEGGPRLMALMARVKWVFNRTIRDRDARDDATQDTLLRLIDIEEKQGSPFEPERDWGFARLIAQRIGTDYRRSVGRTLETRQLGNGAKWCCDPETITVSQMIDKEEIAAWVRGALSQLTDHQKNILTLRYGLGDNPPMTRSQVASKLGTTVRGVHGTELRSLKILWEILHGQEVVLLDEEPDE